MTDPAVTDLVVFGDDEPDNAWQRDDPLLTLVPLLRRRLEYALWAERFDIDDQVIDARWAKIFDDVTWIAERIGNGEL